MPVNHLEHGLRKNAFFGKNGKRKFRGHELPDKYHWRFRHWDGYSSADYFDDLADQAERRKGEKIEATYEQANLIKLRFFIYKNWMKLMIKISL